MARTVRYFLFEQDGAIKRISKRIMDGLSQGDDALPGYAGSRQKVLEVIVDNEDGKPQAIDHFNGMFLDFDGEGRVDHSLRKSLAAAMDIAFAREVNEDNVVSLKPRRERQIWQEKHRWTPTRAELDRVAEDLVRKPGHKAFANVAGVKARRAPLTYEAKSAVREVRAKLSMLAWPIGHLSERALPGFIDEARRLAVDEPEDQYFWEAAALEGERQRELKRLRRTGKGRWVAVFQLFRHVSSTEMRQDVVEHRECEGEQAAISALKVLVREHCDLVGPSHSIEARTMPILEWQLSGGSP
jgi:hypothetical protein